MHSRRAPLRTCIGCRQRAEAEQLLRVVVTPGNGDGDDPLAVPDPRRRMPGRGAWVHPVTACVEQARRRRAFARALRVPGTINADAVGEYVAVVHDGNEAGRADGPAGGTP